VLQVVGVDGDPDAKAEFVTTFELDWEQSADERADVGDLHERGLVGIRVAQPAVFNAVLLRTFQDRVREAEPDIPVVCRCL
jgi:hypothetical protein